MTTERIKEEDITIMCEASGLTREDAKILLEDELYIHHSNRIYRFTLCITLGFIILTFVGIPLLHLILLWWSI